MTIGKAFASFAKQSAVMVGDVKKPLDAADIGEKVCGKLIGDFSRDLVLHMHSKKQGP